MSPESRAFVRRRASSPPSWIAHFLVDDGAAASRALRRAGISVDAVRPVISLRLRQGIPGQPGRIARLLGNARVNVAVQYSDHANRLILVVDDPQRGQEIAEAWTTQESLSS